MRIVVIGGTGLIGSKLVHALTEHGHDAVPASPRTGVNTVTGEGLSEALEGAEVVIDVSNSPTFEDAAAREFFTRSATNLLAAESAAGVGHHVALSVVGTPTLAQQSGYFDAKLTQEKLIAAGPVPHTVVRATQFFEFLDTIAESSVIDGVIRLPAKGIQPMAAADVAEGVAIAALGDPVNGFVEIGGPERFTLPDLIRTALIARGDKRPVITDPAAKYWGIDIDDDTLVPGGAATFFETRFADWILEQAATH